MNRITSDVLSIKISLEKKKIVRECTKRGLKLAAAESCTGGLISALITSVSGSSAVIECGVCSYSNRIKHELLGVSGETLERFTEYSEQCAEEMARGALKISGADIAVSTTGVAGPTGGTEKNPVGTVYICVCDKNSAETRRFEFDDGTRGGNRWRAVHMAFRMILDKINERGK